MVADLNAHDPNAPEPPQGEEYNPVVFDGTDDGNTDGIVEKYSIELAFIQAAATIVKYWTGPWPVLHIERTPTSSTSDEFGFSLLLGFLGETTLEIITTTYFDDDTIEELVNAGISLLFEMHLSINAFLLSAYENSFKAVQWYVSVGFGIAIAVATIAVLAWTLSLMNYLLETNQRSPGWVVSFFLLAAFACFHTALGLNLVTLIGSTSFSSISAVTASMSLGSRILMSTTTFTKILMIELSLAFLWFAIDPGRFLDAL